MTDVKDILMKVKNVMVDLRELNLEVNALLKNFNIAVPSSPAALAGDISLPSPPPPPPPPPPLPVTNGGGNGGGGNGGGRFNSKQQMSEVKQASVNVNLLNSKVDLLDIKANALLSKFNISIPSPAPLLGDTSSPSPPSKDTNGGGNGGGNSGGD
ncbi:hypothetical protein CsSME_00001728 [Camellia sinensis var. sinensis]